MRLLLILDPATRSACGDYFAAHGCTVDTAICVEDAAALLRFRTYDAIIADVAWDEMLLAASAAQRRNASAVPILLTTHGEWPHDARVVTMTKPVRLGAILETVGEIRNQKSEIRNQKGEAQKIESRNQKPETRNQAPSPFGARR